MSGELRLQERIVLNTDDGAREIQLLFGDITKLPVQEKVDVIMVSAFPGDYSATPTSVIGALKRSLNLSVRDLARDRAQDLRRNFYCWWSQPLPPNTPYRRLLCFERPPREISHPARLVGDVFRALVPAFDNQESTVITPILASGDQNYSQPVMMKAMVDAAAHWILIGLPLTCLKIVVFSRDPVRISKEQETILAKFASLKRYWEARPSVTKEPDVRYDVYLSYSVADVGAARDVQSKLQEEKPDIKVFSDKQNLDVDSAWQEDIYKVMVTCRRVVTLLSPSYLESKECIEQYNIALCCDRRLKRDILAPFYLRTIDVMPSYMALMQYMDLRVHAEGEKSEMKLLIVCRKFVHEVLQGGKMVGNQKPENQKYDVFLSYCHKNSDKANYLLGLLQKYNPGMQIFFDRNELKTGGLWQKTLYTSMDNSTTCLCLLSRAYLQSAICTEEYNLALVRHLTQRLNLVPIVIEDVSDVIRPWNQEVRAVDARNDFNDIINHVARSVNTFVRFGKKNNVFEEVTAPLDVFGILEQRRKAYCQSKFYLDQKTRILHIKNSKSTTKETTESETETKVECESEAASVADRPHDVVFSYHSQVKELAQYLCRQVLQLEAGPGGMANGRVFVGMGTSGRSGLRVPAFLSDARQMSEKGGKTTSYDQSQPWYSVLLTMLIDFSVLLPPIDDLLMSPSGDPHPMVVEGNLTLAAWRVSGDQTSQKVFRRKLGNCSGTLSEEAPVETLRPDLHLTLGLATEHEHLASVDRARLVVCLLSSHYLADRTCSDEFHIALSRHRAAKTRTVLYTVLAERLLPEPTFGYMFPCHVDVRDTCWSLVAEQSHLAETKGAFMPRQGGISINHQMALHAAALDIVEILTSKDSHVDCNVIMENIVRLKTEGGSGVYSPKPMDQFLKQLEFTKSPTSEAPGFPDPEAESRKPAPTPEPQKEARAASARTPCTKRDVTKTGDVTKTSSDVKVKQNRTDSLDNSDVTRDSDNNGEPESESNVELSSSDVISSSGDVIACKNDVMTPEVREQRTENLGKETSQACHIL